MLWTFGLQCIHLKAKVLMVGTEDTGDPLIHRSLIHRFRPEYQVCRLASYAPPQAFPLWSFPMPPHALWTLKIYLLVSQRNWKWIFFNSRAQTEPHRTLWSSPLLRRVGGRCLPIPTVSVNHGGDSRIEPLQIQGMSVLLKLFLKCAKVVLRTWWMKSGIKI